MPSIENKNVLVTGGAGFIGSHLCDELLQRNANKVVCVDNFFLGKNENLNNASKHENFILYRDDARSYNLMQLIIENEKIEVVFNLATIPLNYSFFNPSDAYLVNIEIAHNLLALLKNNSFKTLIHVSSSEAFGTAKYSPMDENHPIDPTTPYAAGKVSADLMIQSFWKLFDLDISILRPFNNFGPRQNAEGVLAAIIPASIRKILNGEKPILEGDGLQSRDFIYVADTVRGIILGYENENSRKKIINLGTGIAITIKDLLDGISQIMNYTGGYEIKPERKSDVKKLCANINLAKELLNFKPEFSIIDGLKLTLDWYLNNKNL
ncbi:MAG: GDP-mannose 4,6-dehydratase [Deltaproteobacteria bacterium]|jgi:UDP-glucose 4-epimerase|nr:GDP-mannose 4,6-dehydratase [Deltaproteobacteria bacterium]